MHLQHPKHRQISTQHPKTNKNHPYFIAGQFHPELKSRPNRPSPLFVGLVEAAKSKHK